MRGKIIGGTHLGDLTAHSQKLTSKIESIVHTCIIVSRAHNTLLLHKPYSMFHSLAWRDFLPAAHCGSHGHELPTTPFSLAHLPHVWPHLNAFDTSLVTSLCQTYTLGLIIR